MRVPIEWLHDYCQPALTPAQLADRLAMTGTEVERVEHHGVHALEHFVVGRVLEATRHPDADRLTVCSVDLGNGAEPSQIVCGADNVAAGQLVAVASPGAVMPDGTTLAQAQLRGVESRGMILAEDELGIGTEHWGILVLSEEHRPGTPLASVLPISTAVLVLEVTPNRPDCLGIYGVAREAHAATGAPLSEPPWKDDPGGTDDGEPEGVTIAVDCPERLCQRFTARVFEDVEIKASPAWLKARLMAAGQRPISNVVDITNYVMLLTGQPLHAFDLDRVAGARLTVRAAHANEQVETLDGQTRILDEEVVVIEDADGPTSIAGVMGGARSEVSGETTRVLMEAATWDGANIRRTSLKLGLRSEASSRFEKQLQPEQAMEAQAVATRLMLELTGARLVPGTVDVGGPGPAPQTIRLRDERVAGILGKEVPRDRGRQILEALDFTVADAADGLDIAVPAFRRGDVTREADLIEEVARLDGFENLPSTIPSRHGASGRLTEIQRLRRRAQDLLVAQGIDEIVGWSFVAPELADRLRLPDDDPRRIAVELENPLSGDQSQLRTTLLGSLLDAARHNRSHGATMIRLSEAGAVYHPTGDGLPGEPHHVAALLTGTVRVPTWREPEPRQADFFAAKGVLAGLLDGLRTAWSVERTTEPFLHPGRAATILVEERPVGWLGEVHPLVAADWELAQTVAAFELDLDAVARAAPGPVVYEDLTSFPSVREDLAVIVGDAVGAEQVLQSVRDAGSPLLESVAIFDVYADPDRIGEGNVSIALHLSFPAPDRTLTDEEVAQARRAIARALSEDLGGRVRES